ncbi:MAG: hypothetical protein FD170_327 [Bacteroidetes bacterium]|nr:MAG: hypothetical protein FD170_327 [Bacteroidota bacterium]
MKLPGSDQKNRVLKIAFVVALIIAATTTALLIAGYVYGDKAKQMIVDEINRHLLVPVEIGQVEFTILRSFPDASVVFRNVEMKASPELAEAPGLLHARSISLRFGIFSLFTDNYKIRSLSVDGASVTLWKNDKGLDNFNVWKKSTDSSSDGVNFDVQRIQIKNTEVYYRDIPTNSDIAVLLPEMVLKGKITDGVYNLNINGGFSAQRIIINNSAYTPLINAGVFARLTLNEKTSSIDVESCNLSLSGFALLASGKMNFTKGNSSLNLSISSHKADIESIAVLLPESISGKFSDFKPSGRLTFQANLTGPFGKNISPEITAVFDVDRGSFTHLQSNTRLSNIELKGKVNYLAGNQPENLTVEQFSGVIGNGNFKGSLILQNFNNPLITLNLSTKLDLNDTRGFIKNSDIEKIGGELIADIKYHGYYSGNFSTADKASGIITLSNAGITFKNGNREIHNINAQLELNNGSVMVDQLSFKTGESDFKMNGRIQNLLGYLLNADQSMHFEANVSSRNIKLEDLTLTGTAEKSSSVDEGRMFPQRLSFNAEINCENFSYQKFSAQSIKGNLSLSDNVLRANELSFKALDGNITAKGLLNGRYDNHAQVICNATLNNVDISRMFYEFNDFGQSSLQSKHIRGRGDAVIQYGSTLNNRFETDAGTVNAVADVEIRNGELLKFEPLQELSRFLDTDELKNVKFSTLSNRIEIARRTVIIPSMDINSSVMGLKGYGSHTFGNEIDYHFNVLLSEIGRKKNRRNSAPADAFETDNSGRTRLFLHMTGTVDNPEFRYDSQAVARKMADDFKNQKQELRQALREEFGKNKTQTPVKSDKTAPKFEVEWDED